jgi:hypothetical protein
MTTNTIYAVNDAYDDNCMNTRAITLTRSSPLGNTLRFVHNYTPFLSTDTLDAIYFILHYV